MDLSQNFSLKEFTASETAKRYGLNNQPEPHILERLKLTAQRLEDVRNLLGGRPIRVTSGYRGPALNKAVKGADASAHTQGWAVDFVCPSFGTPYDVCCCIRDSKLDYDQIIHEYGRWIHLSMAPAMRRQALSIFQAKRGYLSGILPITPT